MREIITLAVGQCGNQLAYKFWETICAEHSIDSSTGMLTSDNEYLLQKSDVYFNQIEQGRYIPRAVLIDLEPGVLDSI
jgi:tubulin beta